MALESRALRLKLNSDSTPRVRQVFTDAAFGIGEHCRPPRRLTSPLTWTPSVTAARNAAPALRPRDLAIGSALAIGQSSSRHRRHLPNCERPTPESAPGEQ
jgi:hypothetical protein